MFDLIKDVALVGVGFFGGYWLQTKFPGLHTDIINKGKTAWTTVKGWFKR